MLFGDDLIGITKIDLDDRNYSQSWLAIDEKPIEYRDLYDGESTVTQGVIKMWLEIYDADAPEANEPPLEINSAPEIEFEVRVVVWKTRKVKMVDASGCSDVFVRCFFDPNDDKKTDTHWRNQNGKASFNYRLKFPIKSSDLPHEERMKNPFNLTVQAWDKDIISKNDLIGSRVLPIDYLIEDACKTNKAQYITKAYWDGAKQGHMKQ